MFPLFGQRLRLAFAPPRYLAFPFSGVDVSTSGVKVVRLKRTVHGLVLDAYADVSIPTGAFIEGEIANKQIIVDAISEAARKAGIHEANVALPESKSYLFDTNATGSGRHEWRMSVEPRLDELVPLPPAETAFDLVRVAPGQGGETSVVGVGFARRVVEDTLAAFDAAHVVPRSLEGETFAIARALLPTGDESTTLIVDVGKTTTKLSIVAKRIPRFSTTIAIGGHALTLAVQKHFGVTETEARKVKRERGIVPATGNEDYLAAMLSTVSAIKDEIAKHLEYWQSKKTIPGVHEPVTRAILAGGNATVRGFPEYLEGGLRIPVATGNVFTNMASHDHWLPPMDYSESLAYATAIGLALRDGNA